MPTPDFEEVVQSVMQGVNLTRLRGETDALVRTLVTEQLHILRLRLRQELEAAVRQAVSEAMTSLANQHKLK